MHEELLKCLDDVRESQPQERQQSVADTASVKSTVDTDSGEWVQVVAKKHNHHPKQEVLHHTEPETPVTRIFGGQTRSLLRTVNARDSVRIEPFHSLQVDITPDHVHTVVDAIQQLTKVEILENR